MVVLQAGPRTEVRRSATSDRQALRRALQAAESSGPGGGSVQDGGEPHAGRGGSEIHRSVTGQSAAWKGSRITTFPLVFHRVGEQLNVAITSLDVRANPK